MATDKKAIQSLFETLAVVRAGTEDDFELRSSADESVWGVRLFDENPNRPTYVLYAGPEAKELACDSADYDLEDEDEADDDDDDDEE